MPFRSGFDDIYEQSTICLAIRLTAVLLMVLRKTSSPISPATPEFKVIARNSTAVYKGKPGDVRQIGNDLNVQYVLEGSFQRQGDQVRITAQLIDTATGTHVWSERYDRPADKLFAIQSEVADRIANSLGGATGRLPGSVLAAAKRKRPGDLGAYELFLLGRDKAAGLTLGNQLEAKSCWSKRVGWRGVSGHLGAHTQGSEFDPKRS
jgi:Tol biopolymer transport system component